jgi:hypothetical protein
MNRREERERRAARKMRDSVKSYAEFDNAQRYDYYEGEEEFLARKRERQLQRSDERIRKSRYAQ